MIRIVLVFLALSSAAFATCPHPWVFFDLGDTLVDTKTSDDKVFYMPGAHAYLKELRAKGYTLGMLVNYPDKLGGTEAGKIAHLKAFIAEKWWRPTPDAPAGFEWTAFQAGLHVPPNDTLRKPHPYLFQKALRLAQSAGCKAIYIGETPQETQAAKKVGMYPFLYVAGQPFLPESEIDGYVK